QNSVAPRSRGRSSQPIRSSNSRSRLPGDQRSTTESTEIHGKENPNQLPLSVSFPGAGPRPQGGVVPWLPVCDDPSCRGNSRPSMKSLDAPDLVEKLCVLVHGIEGCRLICPTTKLSRPDRREQPSGYHRTQRRGRVHCSAG